MVVTAALATVSCVFPGLATGALAVQASDDFGISEGTWGRTLGAFFLGAALSAVPAGRLAQRLGPRRQLTIGLALTAAAQLSIAFVVRNFIVLLVVLAFAGVMNSVVQTAVNLAISRARLARLGLAMATKQSAMPASAMLGGLAVPAIALTIGWRWAYAAGCALAVATIVLVYRSVAEGEPAEMAGAATSAVVESSRQALFGAALVSLALSFSAGSIIAWTVSSGVDAGLAEGTAGLVLSGSAILGICVRLLIGQRVDKSQAAPLRSAARITTVGVVGFLLLSFRVPGLHVVASILAFAGGWVWPVLTNFAIVNANPRSAGAATGVTQMGVYIGVFSAPLITGWIVDSQGYQPMWLLVAVVGAAGVVGAWRISPNFPR